MSVDILQDKIRKSKNASVVCFYAIADIIPNHILQQEQTLAAACGRFAAELLDGLKGVVPAVRFDFASFSLLGADGLAVMSSAMARAGELGYYVIMDLPELLSQASSQAAVLALNNGTFPCNGVVVSAYLGSDILQTMKALCKDGISVFAVARTANKSAVELQDLLTGGRLVHTAAADVINRHGEAMIGKCGYSQMGALAASSSADSLRTLRSKYSRLFLLLDGFDYPNSNAKNCSFAFDRFGHGAAACAGVSILSAWKEAETDGTDYVSFATAAAERMKKNINRYINIL